MKRALRSLIGIFVSHAFLFSFANAQSCNVFDLKLTTQAAVNSFNASCKTINGDITISGADITDLTPLQNIEVMNGKLTIQANPKLASLTGLESITSAQHLLIYSNDLLPDLTGFKKLKAIWGTTHIRFNKNLDNLKGLDSLVNASTFYITNNDSLTSLSGLGSLESVSDILSIGSNVRLATLKGLDKLSGVSRINIGGNDALADLSGLENLTSVSYQMHVSSNPGLTSLKGLDNLTYLSELYISDNNLMTDLSGLESVGSVFWLVIGESKGLTSLAGLSSLTSATNMIIRSNELLTDLSGLENLTNIGWIQISDNAALASLSGLGSNVRNGRSNSGARTSALTIGGLVIQNNASLSDCAISAVCEFVGSSAASITGNGPGCEDQSAIQAACSALPVTLADFKARKEGRAALLQWTTAEESNSEAFGIEHSVDAMTWHEAGEHRAKGESNVLVHYQWVHNAPAGGLNYYRLKMKDRPKSDLEGAYAYSRIVSVLFSDNHAGNVYPNPVSDVLFIESHREAVLLRIVNTEGKTVYEARNVPQSLSMRNLATGIYQMHITLQNGVVQKERIVVL